MERTNACKLSSDIHSGSCVWVWWWFMAVILALGKLRQDRYKFKVHLAYIVCCKPVSNGSPEHIVT